MMFDRRLVECFDWGLLSLTFTLGCAGCLAVYSAVTSGSNGVQHTLYIKQFVWFFGGLSIMVVSFCFNYKRLDRLAVPIYLVGILLLISVLFIGKYVSGSRRWLSLGIVSFQPSELIKMAVILILARTYSKNANLKGLSLRQLILPMTFTLIPFFLIVRQPDLGTAILVLLIAASMTVFVKIERRTLFYLIISGVVAIPMVWFFLKGYQKQRILTFLSPDRDPLGSGYHIIQSKIAIGSGMLNGKGFLKGTQNALNFLPEQHTDFIFSVLAEEWGFVGAAIVLTLFLMLILWCLNIALGSRDSFGTILSFGITAMIFWQVFINIGMVMGLMPVVGVPLPFISYGGSSVITMMLCIGLLLNVSMRRFMFE